MRKTSFIFLDDPADFSSWEKMLNYVLKMRKSFVVICIQPALDEGIEQLGFLYTHYLSLLMAVATEWTPLLLSCCARPNHSSSSSLCPRFLLKFSCLPSSRLSLASEPKKHYCLNCSAINHQQYFLVTSSLLNSNSLTFQVPRSFLSYL